MKLVQTDYKNIALKAENIKLFRYKILKKDNQERYYINSVQEDDLETF